jgi:DNA-binding GntR family transcriptional regulator
VKVPLPVVREGRVLTDWVTASLREAILQGYFEPGEKLDQELIANDLEVSRTPVREALKKLESEGFLEIRPHRGAFITAVSRQDIRDVYEIRALLEAEAVRQATPVILESVLDELEEHLNQTQTQIEAGDSTGHFESDVCFHEAIVNLVENELLKEILDSLNNRIMRVRRFGQLQPGPHLVESHREHHLILQAMRQRDAQDAAKLMRHHLEQSALRVQELAQ